jgi:hypothetical protein
MISITRPKVRIATAGVTLLGAIVFATPMFAAPGDSTPPPASADSLSPAKAAAQSQPASSEQAMAAPGAPESPGNEPVEARIKELHRRLHITDAQKPQWDALTQVMRDNAQAMADLQKQRASDAKSMNAVDVVKSYSEVIQAHEDGMKKFIPAFEDLYNSMSDAQKKTADSMFRGRARTEAKAAVSKES